MIYKSKRQEAKRKGLLKMLFAKARARGLSDDELRDAIMAEARRKPRPGIILKDFNYKKSGVRPSDKSGVRPARKRSVSDPDLWTVSLSSLKIWQLNQVLMAIFPEGKNNRIGQTGESGVRSNDKSGVRSSDKSGIRPATGVSVSDPESSLNIIEFDDWHKGEKDGNK